MAGYRQELAVGKARAQAIKAALAWEEGDREDLRLTEDETITETAVFENGLEMDIKCCGTQEGAAWTEAVLFDENGSQLTFADPEEDFFGEWELEYEGDTYIVEVTEED